MTTFDLINNYRTLIDTQYTLYDDAAKALQVAWDMCMDMGKRHGFSKDRCHECWCRAMQARECEAKS